MNHVSLTVCMEYGKLRSVVLLSIYDILVTISEKLAGSISATEVDTIHS